MQDNAYPLVSVEDNGPGIPDEMKEKVFNRLHRGDTKARGMGPGLYPVRSLLDSYNGRVWSRTGCRANIAKTAGSSPCCLRSNRKCY